MGFTYRQANTQLCADRMTEETTMTEPKQCAVCGGRCNPDPHPLSLQLRRDNPDYRWILGMPLQSRRLHPWRHDRINLVSVCSEACMRRAIKRNGSAQALADHWHAAKEKKETAQHRLREGQANGQRIRTCPCCGEAFPIVRATAQYCSAACRRRVARQREQSG